jgi:hypothetical protein
MSGAPAHQKKLQELFLKSSKGSAGPGGQKKLQEQQWKGEHLIPAETGRPKTATKFARQVRDCFDLCGPHE